jgi:hydrogenase maturation protein HypF
MELLERPVVMTSANLSAEPQVIDNAEARAKLRDIADLHVMHDREIANRIDDSVVRLMGGQPRIFRRARGYAPAAIPLPPGFDDAPDLLAYGAELKSTFCLTKHGAAVLSQHQGDLEDVATFEDFQKNLRLYAAINDHRPSGLVADLHPEYLSTKLALARRDDSALPLWQVQHHHAHAASCMVENGLARDCAPVLGVVLDGLGWGDDETFWGGEILFGGYVGMRRMASLKPVAMPGGMQAIREPWRSTYAHLRSAFGGNASGSGFGSLTLYERLRQKPLDTLDRMLEAQMNCPVASSCGRLFDAVAAALGLCFDRAAYEGQGAMMLEALAAQCVGSDNAVPYPFRMVAPTASHIGQLDSAPMWHALLRDLHDGQSPPLMAARFHHGLAQGLVQLVQGVRATLPASRPDTVVLSGGCMQNAILFEALQTRLDACGLKVLSHASVPGNDGGIALGQVAVAAARQLAAGRPVATSSLTRTERSESCV